MPSRSSFAAALAAIGLALAAVLTPAGVVAAAPANDDVGSATAVTAIPFDDSVAVADATTEDGEPTETCAPFGDTVWYAVTLPSTTELSVDTAGSNYDTTIAVWLGSGFDDVELVACNDDTVQGQQAAVGFTAAAATTYLVQVGAFFDAPADAVLSIHVGAPPRTNRKPTIIAGSVRGKLADAFVEEYDDASMTYSNRSVQVLDGSVRAKGATTERVSQLVLSSYEEQYDDVDDSYTWVQWLGTADLDPAQFAIDRRLRSARVDADVTMVGETCTDSTAGFECTDLGSVDVAVDVTWTGDGSVVRIRERSSESVEGARFRYHTNASLRPAIVAGGATGGMDLDFTGATGRIVSGADGYWTWVRGGTGAFATTGSIAMLLAQLAPVGVQVESARFRGSFAIASNEVYDEDEGSFRYQDVLLNIGESRTTPGRWSRLAEVSVHSVTQWYDEGAQTMTVEEWSGSGELSDGFVGRRLDRAAATADVTLWGSVCTFEWEGDIAECTDLGETTVAVAVEWDGVGPTFRSSYLSDSRSDAEHVRYQGRSTNRAATADGAVTGDVVHWDLVDAAGWMGRSVDSSWSTS